MRGPSDRGVPGPQGRAPAYGCQADAQAEHLYPKSDGTRRRICRSLRFCVCPTWGRGPPAATSPPASARAPFLPQPDPVLSSRTAAAPSGSRHEDPRPQVTAQVAQAWGRASGRPALRCLGTERISARAPRRRKGTRIVPRPESSCEGQRGRAGSLERDCHALGHCGRSSGHPGHCGCEQCPHVSYCFTGRCEPRMLGGAFRSGCVSHLPAWEFGLGPLWAPWPRHRHRLFR